MWNILNIFRDKIDVIPFFLLLKPKKLWCAVGVNLSGGKTRDGGSVVGASVFYKDVAGLDTEGSKQRSASQSSLDKLDQELKEQQKELKNQEELSSLVWICTSTHSATKVIIIDAVQPGNILDSFTVCNSHVLCIASVPGKGKPHPFLPTIYIFVLAGTDLFTGDTVMHHSHGVYVLVGEDQN